jgi:hypothetical protein
MQLNKLWLLSSPFSIAQNVISRGGKHRAWRTIPVAFNGRFGFSAIPGWMHRAFIGTQKVQVLVLAPV